MSALKLIQSVLRLALFALQREAAASTRRANRATNNVNELYAEEQQVLSVIEQQYDELRNKEYDTAEREYKQAAQAEKLVRAIGGLV